MKWWKKPRGFVFILRERERERGIERVKFLKGT